jgi:hypothetical protein
MKDLKLNFSDFWSGFNKTDNWFYNFLKPHYNIEISDNPDFLIYSVFGREHLKYDCKKIFFSGENIGPDYNDCHYSLTFDWLDIDKHYRLPLYVLYDGYYDLVNKKVDNSLLDRKFCNFIVSNGNNSIRNDFFIKLNKYKRVDSGGGFMNNIGFRVGDKLEFQKNYKFSSTFENNAYRIDKRGYTTEKIMQSMMANSIPIYWGNEWVDRDFNTKSFINYHDFKNESEVIDYIIYLDKNDEEYMKVMREPWFNDCKIPDSNKPENILNFFKKIFN